MSWIYQLRVLTHLILVHFDCRIMSLAGLKIWDRDKRTCDI